LGGGKATLFDEDEVDGAADRMKRVSITRVLGDRQDEDALGDPLGIDIDALAAATAAAAAAAAAAAPPVKQTVSSAAAAPVKASGAAAAFDSVQLLRGHCAFDCLTPCVAGKKKSAGSLFQDVDDSHLF
jgi:hypothetical protein